MRAYRFYLVPVAIFFFVTSIVFGQEQFITHIVEKGETITKIAQKYRITSSEIYRLNPDCIQSLRLKSVILIPIRHQSIQELNVQGVVTESRSNKDTIQDRSMIVFLKSENASDKTKQNISGIYSNESYESNKIVTKESLQIDTTKSKQSIIHKVLPKETKYSIATKYKISVEELERQNPTIIKRLRAGKRLKIVNEENIQGLDFISNGESNNLKESEEKTVASEVTTDTIKQWDTNVELADELIRRASSNLGVRYRSGGISRSGFDCSGLVFSTFASFDIKLPRSSFRMAEIGRKINFEEAKKGDLIFFKTRGRKNISHVGMVVGLIDGEIKFIHSSTQHGVIISSTRERYYERKFSQINRVLQ